MLRRLLAAAFAALFLFVAFGLRSDRFQRETGDDPWDGPSRSSRPDGSAGEDGYDVFERDEVRLLCIEDLREACEDLVLLGFAVRDEPAWTTVDRLRDGGTLGADVWLTVEPFPELARPVAGAPSDPSLAVPTAVLARSPIVAVGSAAAVDARSAACPDAAVLLSCLAGSASAGTPTVLRDPAASALGALAFSALATELRADPAVPLAADPALTERLRTMLGGARRSQAPLEDVTRIGGSSLAVTVEAEMVARFDDIAFEQREAESANYGIRYPLDVRPVELVAVPTPGFPRPRDLQAALLSRAGGYAFERAGWVAEGRPSYLSDDIPLFAGRPAVRTDLSWDAELVREVRKVAAR